ncbi:putative neutral zinc metallopeptidase [compost metagenome]
MQRAQRAARSEAEGNKYSVALELQADCYAGVWARNAASVSGGQVALEPGDLEEGMKTAQAIGDDTLQRRGGGRVSPESFTHGSSAQRVEWLQRGYQTGDPAACDTFKGL